MRRRSITAGLVGLLLVVGLLGPIDGAAAHGGWRPGDAELAIQVAKAPVSPDGATAGAVTDLVVDLAPADPMVPGLELSAGATIEVTLPAGFESDGTTPFRTFASPGCAPPLVQGCNTALELQGWPQSPVPPFPTVSWDPDRRTVTLTMAAEWAPAGSQAPGPKQVHLLLLGFRNPERAGNHRLEVTVRPDPAGSMLLRGTGRVRIERRPGASIEVINTVNGAPPPPFPNAGFQQLRPGASPLRFGWYLWGRRGEPIVGATLSFRHGPTRGLLLDGDGRPIGTVRVRAPRGPRHHELVGGGPSQLVPAFITGTPVGLLTADLQLDPGVTGRYSVTIDLWGGGRRTMTVLVSP